MVADLLWLSSSWATTPVTKKKEEKHVQRQLLCVVKKKKKRKKVEVCACYLQTIGSDFLKSIPNLLLLSSGKLMPTKKKSDE